MYVSTVYYGTYYFLYIIIFIRFKKIKFSTVFVGSGSSLNFDTYPDPGKLYGSGSATRPTNVTFSSLIRAAVSKFTAEGSLPQETIDQLKARIKVPEISIVVEPVAPTATPAKTAAAKVVATPKAPVATPAKAVATPAKAIAATPAKAVATPAKAVAATPAKAVPVAATAAKRKPEGGPPASGDKKARLKDPNELRVYVETEIMRSSKVSIIFCSVADSVADPDPWNPSHFPGSGSV